MNPVCSDFGDAWGALRSTVSTNACAPRVIHGAAMADFLSLPAGANVELLPREAVKAALAQVGKTGRRMICSAWGPELAG